jgi:hypothetical protein
LLEPVLLSEQQKKKKKKTKENKTKKFFISWMHSPQSMSFPAP